MRNLCQSNQAKALVLVIFVTYCVIVYAIMINISRYMLALSQERLDVRKDAEVLDFELNDTLVIVPRSSSDVSEDHEEGRAEEWTEAAPAVLVLKGLQRRQPWKTGQEATPEKDVHIFVPLNNRVWQKLTSAMKDVNTIMFPWKQPEVKSVDCQKLFQGDPEEMKKAKDLEQQNLILKRDDRTVGSMAAASCSSFKKTFTFITRSLTEEEMNFPIAYSLLVFKGAEQVVNLLSAIYRPQNYYCVHVDSKSDDQFRQAMTAVAHCFPNVFLSSRSINVQWGSFSVLEPEIVCMEDLWRYKKWKYFINLTGQEFPLKTNYELVRILTAYRGANSLEGTRKRANTDRFIGVPPPPGGITLTKGSVHVTVNRDFVDFILHSALGRDFLQWARRVAVPDEVYFSSLNHNPQLGIRGTYLGEPETHPTNYPFITRFKNWGTFPFNYPCASGKRVRMICILSSGDLPLLDSRPELFANKFYVDQSRVALECLAERLFNRTRDRFLGHMTEEFNVTSYANMPFVTNMVLESTFLRDPA